MSSTNLKDKMAKGLMWSALNNGGIQFLNIVIGIVIARRLDPGDFGLMAMIVVFSTIASNLQESGFITALINRKNPTKLDYNSVFWFNVTVSVFLYVVLWFCAPLIAAYNHQPILTSLARYTFIGFFLSSFSIVPRSQLMKQLRVKEQTIVSLVSLSMSGIVGIVMAINGMAYWGLATQTITYITMTSILSWLLTGWRPTFMFNFRPIREMFGFSVNMLVTNVLWNLNRYAFETLMGRYYPKSDIGQYSQANKWNLMGSSLIIGMVLNVAQPMFVAIRDESNDPTELNIRYQRVFRKMLRFICFITFPAMLGLSLVAPEFIIVTVTDKYLESARMMQILCLGGAFLPIATLYNNFLISRGKSNLYMWNMIAQVAIILSDLFAVQYFHLSIFGLSGIYLMIVIYVAIIILWTFVWHWFLWREIRLSLWLALRDIMPFLFVATLTMVLTYILTKSFIPADSYLLLLISRICLAAIIYFSALWLLKAKVMRECIGYLKKR